MEQGTVLPEALRPDVVEAAGTAMRTAGAAVQGAAVQRAAEEVHQAIIISSRSSQL